MCVCTRACVSKVIIFEENEKERRNEKRNSEEERERKRSKINNDDIFEIDYEPIILFYITNRILDNNDHYYTGIKIYDLK